MTRLELQIQEKENELQEMKNFSSEKLAIFNSRKNELITFLKKYKIEVTDWDNQMIEKRTFGNGWIINIWLKADLSFLSVTQRRHLETGLRSLVPMPICPIGSSTIHIVYHI